jgi:DNA-binding LacI/PurR family transcriptional regulator
VVKRPTIADIALRAGVSKGAVSYALNDRPGVSASTRVRVLQIAQELGWEPNSAARALSAARSDTVGLVLARPARMLTVEPFFTEFIAGIEMELAERRIALLLQVVEDHAAELITYRRWWQARRVDGIFLVDLCAEDERVRVLAEGGMPTVVVGGPEGVSGLTSVWTDDATAMTAAVEYLVALGHRRIARVGGPPGLQHTRVRTRAFREATTRLGIRNAPVTDTDFTDEVGAGTTRALLAGKDRPTAILYDNDIMAVAGNGVAGELGLRVPEELSLLAWDDSVLCRLTHPSLSAMGHDVPAYGAHAARRLLDLVAGASPGSFPDATPVLTPRGSTGPVPAPG